ncbi:MAG: metallophosphoesterase family protein [Gammaproteobacteria bacterium]|nr:metallophosphoesterase family protein [Gammaproteobacteria bacterium]
MAELGEFSTTVLVFGGPYSNLEATSAMRVRAADLGITTERIICTGDIVAYCAEPGETIDLIRNWGIHVVMGNCEEALAFSEPDCGCGFEMDSSCSTLAITWYEYANRRVDATQRAWMSGLPRSIEFVIGGVLFKTIHASLTSINEFVFPSSDASRKLTQISEAGVDAIIGGHSGIPFGQRVDNSLWLNAGVIGMPANDGGKHGWYMLIDPIEDGLEISWHRLDYDHAASRQSTIAAGMVEYGRALGDGLWPSIDILPETEARQSGQPLNLPPIHF